MTYNELLQRALEIRAQYDTVTESKHRKIWNGQDVMAGFVADVGELSEIIMAKHGLRELDNVDERLAHELSDCLWSVMVLASKYNVDLEKEFLKTMNQLETRIANQQRHA